MGRLFGWFGVPVGLFLGWYERLFSFEWLAWIFRGEWAVWLLRLVWDGGWWLLKGLFQVGIAALALAGISMPQFSNPPWSSLPSLPWSSGPSVEVTHDVAEQMRKWMGQYMIGDTHHDDWYGKQVGPSVEIFGGNRYWAMILRTIDHSSYVGVTGHPLDQECQHLYVSAVIKDGDRYLTPQAYNLLGQVAWPEIVKRCMVYNAARYWDVTYEYPTLNEKGIETPAYMLHVK